MARTNAGIPSEPYLPLSRQVASEFPGMASNLDPHDLPAGAAVLQINILPRRPGELRTRAPLALLKFED
jgi:hypothetical protein